MIFPLTIEQFQQEPEFKDGTGAEFLKAFINAVNGFYEFGRKLKDNSQRVTVEMLQKHYEHTYNEKCSSADNSFFDIYAKYANDAYQQGVKDSAGAGAS